MVTLKKFMILFFAMTITLISLRLEPEHTKAASDLVQSKITILENGDYLETVIYDNPVKVSDTEISTASKTITKTKTTYYKNSAGTTLWSVAITATFTYNGSTSKCTSCHHSTTCLSPSWRIKSASSSKSGNSATATATATHFLGNSSKDYFASVKITCSKTGVVS